MNEASETTLESVAADGRATAWITRMWEGPDAARWAAVTSTSAAALAQLVEEHGGMGARVHTFFALHDEAAGRAARQGAGFESVRNQNRLMLEAVTEPVAPDLEVRAAGAWSPALETLFESVPPGPWARRIRDEAWYEERPDQDEALVVARGDHLVGFASARSRELAGERALWVGDWQVLDDGAAAAASAALVARATGSRVGWILPDTVPDWIVLQRLGARIEPTPWFLDVRTASRQTTDRWLHRHWAYTLADFPGLA